MTELKQWDMADYINDEEDIVAHLNAALAENDLELLFYTIGAIGRSSGMGKLAKRIGVSRESLYRSFSAGGNPSFATVLKALDALGYDFSIAKRA